MTETSSVEAYARSQEPIANSSDELVFAVDSEKRNETDSGSTKKKSKSLKTSSNMKKKQKPAAESVDDQAVMRTSSLPNVLDEPEALTNETHERISSQGMFLILQDASV